MTVKELMTRDVITVSPDASLKDVAKIFIEKRISGVPVITEGGQVVGIITLTDMLNILSCIYEWKELERGDAQPKLSEMSEQEKKKAKVKDVMTNNVFVLEENDSIDDVMRMMFENKVHSLPVTREGKIVGIVGKRDLVLACF